MIEIKGKYNEAKIFTDVVDSASIAQVQELCNQEFTAGSRIRLMPDIHAGAGCTIGTTMTITDKVVPNLVGVDIGCGMETTRIREGRLELQKLDKLIYEKIPSGFSIRDKAHRYLNEIDLSELCCARHVDLLRAEKSIGTLGGGNHFIEVDKDDEGNLYIVVHSGSRHLGVEVASYYQEAGYKVLNRTDDASIEALIARMKAEGREKEIQKELKKLKNLKQTNIPKALAYVSGELFEQYIHDMKIVQHFAMLNRQAMMDEIVKGMKLHVEEQFTTIHNYIDIYLQSFAPDMDLQEFEERVCCVMENRMLVDVIDRALLRLKRYPDRGELYYEILTKQFIHRFNSTEKELLDELNMERSVFYDRKREAIFLLSLCLFGYAVPELQEELEMPRLYPD